MEDEYTVTRGSLHRLAHEIAKAIDRATEEGGLRPQQVADLLLLFAEGLISRAEAAEVLAEALGVTRDRGDG